MATAAIDARIRRLFPFELTAGQEQAIAEIAADMAGPLPMNRLLQGDVGSGKTIVAVYAMLLAVAHGYQAVLMAPTEVLARQHALTLEPAPGRQLRSAAGSSPAGCRPRPAASCCEQIAAGEMDLVVGTQAIIQEDVRFARLGLVVIDEQHRFGVRQRALLRQSGQDPHYLVMTATPIPRTVTMTLFGDLDVSTLADSPPGRQKVNTYLADETQRGRWWEFFGRKLREGRQGYVVMPLVEESEAADGHQPRRGLRDPGQRRAGGLPPGPDPRPHELRREGRRDGPLPPRRDPGAGLHVGGRGGRRRAQRHADDHRGGRALRPGPTAPVARPDQPRQLSRLLLRLCRSAEPRNRPSG